MRKKAILVNFLAFIAGYFTGLIFDYLTLNGEVSFIKPVLPTIGALIGFNIFKKWERPKEAVSK